MHELRIHGVGPQRPASVLGALEDGDVQRIPLVGDPDMQRRLAMWRRKPRAGWPDGVHALLWSGLTSDSRMQALWPLLLPFTLLNVAGFAHPVVRDGHTKRRAAGAVVCRLGVLVLGFLLTASWGVWLAVLALMPMGGTVSESTDVPAPAPAPAPASAEATSIAVSARVLLIGTVLALVALLIGAFCSMVRTAELPAPQSTVAERLAGMWGIVQRQLARLPITGALGVVGFLAAGAVVAWALAVWGMDLHGGEVLYGMAGVGVIAALVFVALFTRRDFDDLVVGDDAPASPKRLHIERISDGVFFSKERKRWLFPWSHALLLLAAFVLAARLRTSTVASIWRPGGTRDLSSAPLNGTTSCFLVLGAAQVACLVVIYAGVVLARMGGKPPGPRFRFAAPVVIAGLAVLLSNAVFASLALFLKQRFQPEAPLGAEFMVLDVFVAGVIGTLLLALGVVARLLLARRPAPGESKQRRPRDPAGTLARVSRIPGTMDLPLSVGVVVTWLLASGFFVYRLGWGDLVPNLSSPLMLLALWAMPAAVVLGSTFLRTAVRNLSTRQQFGQVWDVLTLWPRRFHPFAVRSYAEQVVPVLKHHLRESGPEGLVISAHSQGSILTYAALSSLELPEASTARFAVVTYGSPLVRLHARCFPHHFQVEEHRALVTAGSSPVVAWVNCFHQTDPVGHEIFTVADYAWVDPVDSLPGDLSLPIDCCLADPARTATAPAVGGPPLERDRQPGDRLAVHSDYLREPVVKAAVAKLRAGFDGGGGLS